MLTRAEADIHISPQADEPRLLHEFFSRQARTRPDHPAVACNGEVATYLELDRLSDRIAALLQSRGLGPGSLVALYSEKSLRLFAAMLGVLKAGAGYVPIDPRFPIARIQSIVADADVKIVFSDGGLARDLAPYISAEVLCLEEELARNIEVAVPLAPVAVTPNDACYVIYTSGSTGQPKGVVIEHRNAVNFVRSLRSVYGLTEEDRVYQGFSIAFDASVEEIWGALSVGGTLVVPDGDTARSAFDAAEFINVNKVTFFSTVPSFLAVLPVELPTVKLLVLGGEACPPELVARWATPGRRMLNTYGPTEATVVATAAECVAGEPVMIGNPLPGYRTYVLDEQLQPVEPGDCGELYIGGESVARGYLNRPELTTERFIPNPFAPDQLAPDRLYRTFDLVRRSESSGLQFVGRADGQIKIRGFRIELSEIEAILMEHPAVRAAAVNLVEFGSQRELAAYVVLASNVDELDRDSVIELLRSRVPDYMVPRYLDVVQELPAMTSGKVDRNLLPAPCTILGTANHNVVPAATALEQTVIEALEREFRVSPVSVEADFFLDLHGHSLNAARVVTGLRERLDTVRVSVRDLYANRTPRLLARHLENLGIGGGRPANSQGETANPQAARQPRSPPTWFRYPCAFLQLVGLLAFYAVVSAPLALAVVLAVQVGNGKVEFGTALDIATTASFLVWPSWLFLSIAMKWIVIGRYKPGRYPVWGAYYLRWWLVNRFQSLSWSGMFVGTPLMSLYYRAMGAKIGKNCTIGTSICTAFDLISVGDNSSIGSDTHILGYRIEDGWLILGNVTVGRECYVGTHCCLGLNAAMGDRARLGDMSHLPDGAIIAVGEAMRGAPAEPGDVDLEHLQRSGERRGSAFLFGLIHLGLIYAMGYLLILSALPAIALVGAGAYFGGVGLAAAAVFVAAPVSTIWYLALVLAVKHLAIGRIVPGVYRLHSKDYLRYWFLNYLLNNTRHIALALYATLFFPKFLKLLGARIGRGVEISTAMHIMPDLLEIGDGSFLADACTVGGHRIYLGQIELCANKIGKRSFIGNSAMVPAGTDVGDNSLIGVMSTPPAGARRAADGKRWLGSPGFELPNTQHVNCFGTKLTFDPGYGLVFARVALETVRLFLPGTITSANFVLFCMAIAASCQHAPLWVVAVSAPVAAAMLSIWSISMVALVKVVLIDRFEPTVKPLWCSFVWLNEVVNALYESVAAVAMAPLMGTPFIAPCLRMMGCRIGKWVFLETTLFSEFDLVEIGDYASLNLGSTIQTHLFEDRVMKADHLKIGEGCSVGNMAVVLYGTEMKQGSSLGALSVLMKGEVVPAASRWIGIPTRPVEASPDIAPTSRIAALAIQPASRRSHRGLSNSSLGRGSLYRRPRGTYRQPQKMRNGLIYSASIAAAFYFGFVGVRYHLPAWPVVSSLAMQAATGPDPERVSLPWSSGPAPDQAIAHAIEQRQQDTLSPPPDVQQIAMPEPQHGPLEQLASAPTPIPPIAQPDPQWSGDSPSDEVVGAVKAEAKPTDKMSSARPVETRQIRVWRRSQDDSSSGSQSLTMQIVTVEHGESGAAVGTARQASTNVGNSDGRRNTGPENASRPVQPPRARLDRQRDYETAIKSRPWRGLVARRSARNRPAVTVRDAEAATKI
jgi:non-ribosomal peptide synthetase-like protein